MSSKSTSPAARLLRNSRFFSLPNPLFLPVSPAQQYQRNTRNSDTATLPYPIHQAVTTTPNAHRQGNWGLKRSLPTRITSNTSNPVIRVNAMDTREAITDYASAADHVVTLQKISELNLPVTVSASRLGRRGESRPLDPFQPALDNIEPKSVEPGENYVRWKFRGPSLTRIGEGDFDNYIAKELRNRKLEFISFLQDRARQRLATNRRFAARITGRHEASDEDDAADFTEQDVRTVLRQWQADVLAPGASDTMMHRLIAEFLDLPAASTLSRLDTYLKPEDAPAPTHPSAGVSFLRSDAFLANHPILGPQADQPPVEARVLGTAVRLNPPVFTGNSNERIGVAGVVGAAPRVTSAARIRASPTPVEAISDNSKEASHNIGVMTPGGTRLWVAPTKLEIDADGRLVLASQNPSPIAVSIHTNNIADVQTPTRSSSSTSPRDARNILHLGKTRSRRPVSQDQTANFMKHLLD